MSLTAHPLSRACRAVLLPLLAGLTAAGCSSSGLAPDSLEATQASLVSSPPSAVASPLAPGGVSRSTLPPIEGTPAAASPPPPQSATLNPEAASAIRDARALRDAGNKTRALGILEKASGSDKDPALLLERGLLSLELGQLEAATDLLTKAHDPKAPDWRQHSALGAALSAQGRQQDAQAELANALKLAPDNPGVLNNLALSYALDGKHAEAERMLRKIAESGAPAATGSAKAKQNLALIVGLRGNVEEAKRLSEGVLPPEKIKSNVAYLEQLRSGSTKVSKADDAPVEEPSAVASAAPANGGSEPIMQLGQPN